MASVNKVILVGNAGRDAEVRYLPSGVAVANVSIATTSRRKDKASGETVEDTQWHRVQFFDRLAEIAAEFIKKGKPVYIEGRLKYGKYTDQSGVEKPTCDIVASELQLLGGRDESASAPARAPRPAPAPAPRAAAPAMGGGSGGGFNDMDDDIPFVSGFMGHDTMASNRKAKRATAAR